MTIKAKIKAEDELTKVSLYIPVLQDIFGWKNGEMIISIIGGQKITEQQQRTISEEAKAIEGTYLWKLITNTLAEVARQKMFDGAENFEDMRWGKALLYAIGLQKKIVNALNKK